MYLVGEHIAFRMQGAENGFDLRKGPVAYLWTTALKLNEGLKADYQAVGKNYAAQAEFRRKWSRNEYELELSKVSHTDTNTDWEGGHQRCVDLFVFGRGRFNVKTSNSNTAPRSGASGGVQPC